MYLSRSRRTSPVNPSPSYVLGLDDKTYLARTYGASIGKASVTGYCIKFRHLAVINADVLQAAIQYGMSIDWAG